VNDTEVPRMLQSFQKLHFVPLRRRAARCGLEPDEGFNTAAEEAERRQPGRARRLFGGSATRVAFWWNCDSGRTGRG